MVLGVEVDDICVNEAQGWVRCWLFPWSLVLQTVLCVVGSPAPGREPGALFRGVMVSQPLGIPCVTLYRGQGQPYGGVLVLPAVYLVRLSTVP